MKRITEWPLQPILIHLVVRLQMPDRRFLMGGVLTIHLPLHDDSTKILAIQFSNALAPFPAAPVPDPD